MTMNKEENTFEILAIMSNDTYRRNGQHYIRCIDCEMKEYGYTDPLKVRDGAQISNFAGTPRVTLLTKVKGPDGQDEYVAARDFKGLTCQICGKTLLPSGLNEDQLV